MIIEGVRMIKLFHVLSDKLKLKKEPKEGQIEKQFDTGYDDLLAILQPENKTI